MLFNQLHQGGIRALLAYDDTIFDTLVLPEDLDDEDGIVRGLILDDILIRHGDTPLFIPDPTVMKYYVGSWSTRMLPLFERYWNAIIAEYNPIENYNRDESRTDSRNDSIGNTRTLNTNSATTGTFTSEKTVSAENANTYSPDEKTEDTPNTAVADTGTIADQGAVVGTTTITSNVHGNIGVTSSQQMLNQELDLIPRLDLIRIISDSWAAEFCLAVY